MDGRRVQISGKLYQFSLYKPSGGVNGNEYHTSSIEMMVLHHPTDLPNDLDLDLGLDLDLNLDLDFWHIDHWPYGIQLYDSTSS